MCCDSLDMKVGWFLSIQIPSVPQRIDFKTYLGFTDSVPGYSTSTSAHPQSLSFSLPSHSEGTDKKDPPSPLEFNSEALRRACLCGFDRTLRGIQSHSPSQLAAL